MKIINELIITIIGIVCMALFMGLILFGMWVAEYHSTIGIIVGVPIVIWLFLRELD